MTDVEVLEEEVNQLKKIIEKHLFSEESLIKQKKQLKRQLDLVQQILAEERLLSYHKKEVQRYTISVRRLDKKVRY